jgi:hypothetical protein
MALVAVQDAVVVAGKTLITGLLAGGHRDGTVRTWLPQQLIHTLSSTKAGFP